ncbi:MAG: adenylosuccinate lyase [Bacteroidales bacterium]|nr:adenylosuccinate lyase [Bacteroidales bacterium]NLK81478.1 adenylosuccinate lyase [Bacteroidales bacterium]
MKLNSLTAISPIDGRYRDKTQALDIYFSEYALIKYRVLVEIEYFISLCSTVPQLQTFDSSYISKLQEIYISFTEADAQKVKEIEKTTNHDVKAVEYFIKQKFDALGLQEFKEFIHFGLTSQDINNTAIPYSLKDAIETVILPQLNETINTLTEMATEWEALPMLARTHGQPASPTRLGKEIAVFVERLNTQKKHLETIPFSAKFGGATGNFNAHHVAYPHIDWVTFGNNFVNNVLGLHRSQTTTQIEHYDNISALCDASKRINTILIDLCRDFWTYISMDYFKQKIKKNEVGSSAMPHKVNPIDFENAEGNLGIANAIFSHLAEKLPISRLQRDLTDSTVLRNIGVPFAHMLIAIQSLQKGLGKVLLHESTISADLEKNWSVVAEAIQTILRRENYPNAYECLKDLTRTHSVINQDSIAAFIDTLTVSEAVKKELKAITPWNYTGV